MEIVSTALLSENLDKMLNLINLCIYLRSIGLIICFIDFSQN